MGDVKRLSASVGSAGLHLDVEDLADILLEFSSGAIGTAHMDMLQRAPVRYCRVFGDRGTLVCDAIKNRLDLYNAEDATWSTLYDNHALQRNSMYVAQLEHFVRCVQGEAEPIVSGSDGRLVLQLVLAAKSSANTGRSEII
jgi:predicted dehydrogenase